LWCGRYSPFVAPDPPNGIWVDITGCAALFGSEHMLLKDVGAADNALSACRFVVDARRGGASILPAEADSVDAASPALMWGCQKRTRAPP
jgi:hypothetical protein